MKNILIINGPNLNLLGQREVEIYGKRTLETINEDCKEFVFKHNINVKLSFFQSNSEEQIINKIQSSKSFDGLIINAAAFTHTSIAIHDSLKIVNFPIVEVHLSNLYNREEFRQKSLISPIASGIILGFGSDVYKLAIMALNFKIKN
ncbi:MAG: type II 3-dehydroquinate dehydratase [Rickettsiales bacterium]|nr:type II 3-dehydroquinate dehydratase [Rickettsiales bacterium]OUV52919.1 MAG: type II 3-dehydroquinate dehydratase [Rickettsiales bacterium TMED127]|tara:strand:+ start:24267 stop:24707 length:441 start_codon:yes stop_codon:yes gene_type:complete